MNNQDLIDLKNKIVDSVIDELTSNTNTDEERKLLKKDITTRLEKDIVITQLKDYDVVVDANEINTTMNELYIDLLTTFGILDHTGQNLSGFNVLYNGYIDFIGSRINQIRDKIEGCQKSLSDLSMPNLYIERFRSAENFNKARNLQKDRYGQWIPSRCFVNYASNEHFITLPLLKRDNSMRYDEKVETAYLSTSFQLGKGFLDLNTSDTDISNAIDSNNSTFWSETILSDAPLRVSFLDEKPKRMYINDSYMYGIDNGAICELEINFESVNVVNELIINPYCKFPIRLMAIRYKLTDDIDEELKEVVSPEGIEDLFGDNYIEKQVSFRFPDILCKKIFILFTQEHYIRSTYIYRPSEVYKNEKWFNNKNENLDVTINAIFKPIYYDKVQMNNTWLFTNRKLVESCEKDLKNLILGDESKTRKIIKYEYQYGFYNICTYNNHFDRTGLYINKPLKCKSNIKSLKLYTNETHVKNIHDIVVTDIEYYVTPVENPSEDDWKPILPFDKTVIESELLFITDDAKAWLRFEADSFYKLMKNGEDITMLTSEYHLHPNPRTGKINCIQIFNYDYDAIYSVCYKPIEDSYVVNCDNKLVTSIENFISNNDTNFKLKNNPFIDSTVDYCTIKFVDNSPNSNGEEIVARNVTEVTNPNISYLRFDDSTNEYQFYLFKNHIYFNKPIPPNHIIDITYRHLISSIMLKAIFRRNTLKDTWLTPSLSEIKYDIETF